MITTKDLELVRQVAETGSLTAAARELHISQSAASQRLTSLHERLGVTLLERRDGRMKLTPAGNRVHMAAQVVGNELASTLKDVRRLTGNRDRQLRLTTQCYTCYRWLPFVIAGLRSDFPELNVDVVPEATDEPYAALREDLIDIAIVSNPGADSEFDEHDLFSDELYAVMSKDHPLAGEQYLDAEQVAGESLILYTGNRHAIVDEILTPANVAPQNIIQVRITEAIIELAREGHGVAVIAGWALDDIGKTEGLSVVRITRSGFRRTWRAVVGEHCRPEYVDAFVKRMRSVGTALDEKMWREQLQVITA